MRLESLRWQTLLSVVFNPDSQNVFFFSLNDLSVFIRISFSPRISMENAKKLFSCEKFRVAFSSPHHFLISNCSVIQFLSTDSQWKKSKQSMKIVSTKKKMNRNRTFPKHRNGVNLPVFRRYFTNEENIQMWEFVYRFVFDPKEGIVEKIREPTPHTLKFWQKYIDETGSKRNVGSLQSRFKKGYFNVDT